MALSIKGTWTQTEAISPKKLLALLILALGSSFAGAESRPRAHVFESGSHREKLLFEYYREESTPNGNLQVKARFTDPQGHQAFGEQLECSGITPKSYRYQHGQIDESASLEVKEGRLHFVYTKDGKTQESFEKAPAELVVGPTIFPYLQAHLAELIRGEKIKFRLAVLDRRETYGFQFHKEGGVERDGRKLMHVSMKPTSFLVAAFVDPIGFYVIPESGKVVESYGSTLLRKRVGDTWEQLSADIIWE